MSSYIKRIGDDKYYCIDDFFGQHQYGYIKMTLNERLSENPWILLQRDGPIRYQGRKVYNEQEIKAMSTREHTTHNSLFKQIL